MNLHVSERDVYRLSHTSEILDFNWSTSSLSPNIIVVIKISKTISCNNKYYLINDVMIVMYLGKKHKSKTKKNGKSPMMINSKLCENKQANIKPYK